MACLLLLACLLLPGGTARATAAGARVRAAITSWIHAHAEVEPDAIELPDLEGLVADVPGAETADVEVRAAPGTPMVGSVPLTVVLERDGRELRHAVVTARLRVTAPMLVAARPLPRGTLVEEADVRIEPREARGTDDFLAAAEQAIGRRTTRSIPQGVALRAGWVEDPPLFERGAPVRLRVVQGALRLETRGRAKEDGRAGGIVRVLNVDSRREVVGRVAADGAVDVEL